MAITSHTATVGTAEYSIATQSTTLTAQTTDGMLQVVIDCAALTAAEEYQVRITEKVDDGTVRDLLPPIPIVGVQSSLFVSPGLLVGEGWSANVKKIAGTDRSLRMSLRMAAFT